MNKEHIKKNIFIVASHFEVAHDLAAEQGLIRFSWVEDFTGINTWGKVEGFNKHNSIIWLGKDYWLHKNYLYIQYLAEHFGIKVIDYTDVPLNPFLIEGESTVH